MSVDARLVTDTRDVLNYTTTADVVAGQVIVVGEVIGIVQCAAPSGQVIGLALGGKWSGAKTNAVFTAGQKVYYSSTGVPLNATENGTGAISGSSGGGHVFMGWSEDAYASGVARANVIRSLPIA